LVIANNKEFRKESKNQHGFMKAPDQSGVNNNFPEILQKELLQLAKRADERESDSVAFL